MVGQGLKYTHEVGLDTTMTRQGQLLAYTDYGDYGVLGGTEIHENKVEQIITLRPQR